MKRVGRGRRKAKGCVVVNEEPIKRVSVVGKKNKNNNNDNIYYLKNISKDLMELTMME